eukprot:CAMPEP_0202845074 /NCGR_PEP_ID=MMETSP1389-20130828/69071_1 /ASSEMBLY_ACC=CAM_ASM_000865 /TAXON_ID=302021 /ORGANISM="Rhodomonas sp., Strain CCMP768" /LENGTH=287 /DNA_ID=CAMNT_0049522475 /DNA_START=15 /DNA_END=878 /DNA_ORIENTATION=-
MRDVWRSGEQGNLFVRIMNLREALEVMKQRGEWEQKDHRVKNGMLHTSFVDRFGSLFDSHHGRAWWYGMWSLFRALVLGVVLSAVFNPTPNAATCLALASLDTSIIMLFLPDGDWTEWIKNAYRAALNTAVVAAVLARIENVMPEYVFSNVFHYLSLAAIAPMIITSLLGPALSLLGQAKAIYSCLTGNTGAVGVIGVAAAAGLDSAAVLQNMSETKGPACEDSRAPDKLRAELTYGTPNVHNHTDSRVHYHANSRPRTVSAYPPPVAYAPARQPAAGWFSPSAFVA